VTADVRCPPSIYAVQPDLITKSLAEVGPSSEANKRLTAALGNALRLADEGQTTEAAELLASYAASEDSSVHKEIALYERGRLIGGADT
jgi:hypothetical protein